jgi:hypothetical protein
MRRIGTATRSCRASAIFFPQLIYQAATSSAAGAVGATIGCLINFGGNTRSAPVKARKYSVIAAIIY